ncbi:phosphoesterase [Halogeometricum borinquense DSM 11551]|uniref:Phosphoesterase n=2 Tax=Halogeometricum borinquense TaxID=60847 RepID=E4NSU2_HALBP|nr:metallophosphoesterase family protein [Halogeometricum borinquense]ADQ65830.1 predicted phosphoesterase [Halogeometricum borinquense DSM 11551]ELY26832.1 phosphoesterase [Halogeometricum borinquense DSM 11551]RYJ14899.1 metallophosphoesterase [Halogeometricum borinquense]
MRVAVISDVHANRVALDAVLDDMPDVDSILCAGDVVGYNPWPAECVAELRARDVPTVMGNHDRAVASDTTFRFNAMAAAGVKHAREKLDDDAMTWLSDLPDERTEFDGRVRLTHDHPRIQDKYTYPDEFEADFLDGEDVLVLGHTHVQGHRVFDEGIVMNPGSVGQPRDGDPRAAYAILDLDDLTVDERRVDYDIEAVVDAVTEAGLPERIGRRLYDGK